jgi:hypothetical protein
MRGRGQEIQTALNPFPSGARPIGMRVIYIVLFTSLVLALAALEIESSRIAARLASFPEYPDVSASPATLAR